MGADDYNTQPLVCAKNIFRIWWQRSYETVALLQSHRRCFGGAG